MPRTRIKSNKAMCLMCHDVIESRSRHDWVPCTCGAIFVDGGLDYLRRGGNPAHIKDLSETEYEGSERFPMEDWKYEVRNGDTVLGYADWLDNQLELEKHTNASL